jgi:hypothetical protein
MKIKNLALISGDKTTIKNGVVTYYPTFADNSDGQSETLKKDPSYADIRSSHNFSQGIIKFKFKAENKKTGVLIIDQGDWNAGISYAVDSFVIRDVKRTKFATSGNLNQFSKDEEICVRFELFGSNAKLFVNDILFCENTINNLSIPLTFRVKSNGKVVLYDIEIESVKPKLFVVMQFSDEYNAFYNDVIKPISEEMGFECIRADEFHSSTPILSDIIRSIKESSAIIAEITPDNPNVFYEIGFAHAIEKPTILICDRNRDKLPFDLSSFRTLFYENSIAGKSKVESSLKKYLENILN